MLFLVIEQFRPDSVETIGERFRSKGRMLPDGVTYHASWVDPRAARCFQIMEAPSAETLGTWTRCWDDLVDFQIIPVVTSAEFWNQVQDR